MNRWSTLARAVAEHGACALVSIVSTKGSVPRGTDAWMIVTPVGFHGTIGGGTLEWKAMAEAQSMLMKKNISRRLDYVLGPDLGQCCGGRVELSIEVFDRDAMALIKSRSLRETPTHRSVYVFGAGHVGRALVMALAPLPFDVTWIDSRPDAFPQWVPQNAKATQTDEAVKCLTHAPLGTLAFIMTHSHTLDLALVDAAIRNSKIAHVGVIGSATKRARFERRLRDAGVDAVSVGALICPIGVGDISSKHPAVIAASVAAQMLQLDTALSACETEKSVKAG